MTEPSYAMAHFFFKQCTGTVYAEGGPRPVNPTMYDFFDAHDMPKDKKSMADMLRKIADQLDKNL